MVIPHHHEITMGFLPFALRAKQSLFKIVPYDFMLRSFYSLAMTCFFPSIKVFFTNLLFLIGFLLNFAGLRQGLTTHYLLWLYFYATSEESFINFSEINNLCSISSVSGNFTSIIIGR